MISPQNMHGSEIIWNEQFIFRNVSVYTYAHVMTINEKKKAVYLKENGKEYARRLLGRKEKGEM